jgi:hypothetical protein
VTQVYDGAGGFRDVEDVDGNVTLLTQKATQAIANLETADANWTTLTATQKDAASRLAVRVSAKLARLALGKLDAN